MDRLVGRWLRLAVVAGAIAGSALVSSAVVAADEAPPIDASMSEGPAIVIDPPHADPLPADPLPAAPLPPEPTEAEAPPALPLEDITVIEMVFVEPDVAEPGAMESEPVDAPVGAVENDAEVGETLPDVLVADVLPDEPVAVALEHGEGGSEHSGNEGGSVGEGRPYLVTFEVEWRDAQGTPIGILDAVLPLEWRSLFELSAAGETGLGPTSATCSYPAGSDVLQCVFDTAGHGSGPDELNGLIVPGSEKATYTVTVVWPPTDWTIEGASDGPYSARASCPRGGHGGGGGHDDGDGGHDDGGHDDGGHDDGGHDDGRHDDGGHDDGGHDDGGQGGQGGGDHGAHRTFACTHRVVMQQIAIIVPPTQPPAVDPEPEAAPPVVPEPAPEAVAPAITPTRVAEAAAASRSTQPALPATGNSVSVLLRLAGLLVVAGSTVSLFSRRTSSAWRSSPADAG